jgi:hypothetical protein
MRVLDVAHLVSYLEVNTFWFGTGRRPSGKLSQFKLPVDPSFGSDNVLYRSLLVRIPNPADCACVWRSSDFRVPVGLSATLP